MYYSQHLPHQVCYCAQSHGVSTQSLRCLSVPPCPADPTWHAADPRVIPGGDLSAIEKSLPFFFRKKMGEQNLQTGNNHNQHKTRIFCG